MKVYQVELAGLYKEWVYAKNVSEAIQILKSKGIADDYEEDLEAIFEIDERLHPNIFLLDESGKPSENLKVELSKISSPEYLGSNLN